MKEKKAIYISFTVGFKVLILYFVIKVVIAITTTVVLTNAIIYLVITID